MEAIWSVSFMPKRFHTYWTDWPQQASAGAFLDVPTISLRSLVLPDVLADNSLVREYFAYAPDRNKPADYSDVDQRHVSCCPSPSEHW